jgi:hypothetical protein
MANTQEKWQEIANRGLQDRFDPETRAKFDEAVNRGLIILPIGANATLIQDPSVVSQPDESSIIDEGVGALETAGTILSSIAAEPISGIAGLGATVVPGADPADVVADVREALTFEPKTEEGRRNLIAVAEKLQPVADVLRAAEEASGQAGFDIAGPTGGAIGETFPTALIELLGLGVARKGKAIAKAAPDARELSILKTGKELDVPVLTSDVLPPKTYVGKFTQSINEKLGPLGSGKARASQQVARENAVQGLADNLEIDLESDFASDIVRSINKKSAKSLERAGATRKDAVDALVPFGEVPLDNTIMAINKQLERQSKLGARANESIIGKLTATKEAIEGGDFSQVKDIRTEVISDLLDVRKGDDLARAEPVYQSVKSAIDEDMSNFAKSSDRVAAAKWEASNRQFAKELDVVKRTEIKRILNSGDATPEKVMPLLRGGKRSELNRLYNALDDTGRESAKKALIQDALKDSRFFQVDETPNPNAFATAMNKANRQQAVSVFFRGNDKKQIDGLTRLLNATRRAQDAAAAPKTGELLTLPAVGTVGGGLVASEPLIGVPAVTAITAIAKAYESKPFRTLLLKLSNSKKGSKVETGLLESALPIVAAGLQAAKTEQEQE